MPSLVQEIRTALTQLETSPRKTFGQNFMINEETLRSIAGVLDLKKGESVIEIGPGLGFLTKELLATGASVLAIEKDRRFAAFLKDKFKDQSIKIIEEDILKVKISEISNNKMKVAGNIPYNITSPILEWLISQRQAVDRAVLTVQLEVAERLTAKPGGKDWGSLSIFLQFYCDLKILKKVGRGQFYPSPKVDSAVVKIVLREKPKVEVTDEKFFFQIVRKAFQKRRKTLLNALESEERSKAFLTQVFRQMDFDSRRRPETLSLEEWVLITESLTS